MEPTMTEHSAPPEHIVEAVLAVWGQSGREHLIPVTGHSMLPLLREGDQVLVAHGASEIRRGDVVVFRLADGTLAAHRVLRLRRDQAGLTLLTKGDNVAHLDPAVRGEQIIGRVLGIRREGRSMALDTMLWRSVGRLMAVSTLAWLKLYQPGLNLKHSLLGPHPHPVTTLLRRGVRVLTSTFFKYVQLLFGRWR
jgi:signal peptidase I